MDYCENVESTRSAQWAAKLWLTTDRFKMPWLRWSPVNNWLIAWRTTTTLLSAFAAAGRQTDADDRELLKSAVNDYHVNYGMTWCFLHVFLCLSPVCGRVFVFFLNLSFFKGRGGYKYFEECLWNFNSCFFFFIFFLRGYRSVSILNSLEWQVRKKTSEFGCSGRLSAIYNHAVAPLLRR
jgi:hypothetical protein